LGRLNPKGLSFVHFFGLSRLNLIFVSCKIFPKFAAFARGCYFYTCLPAPPPPPRAIRIAPEQRKKKKKGGKGGKKKGAVWENPYRLWLTASGVRRLRG